MAVDLHLHSNQSDGSDTPAEIVAKASAIGLSAIALTDHDNLNGIAEARSAAASSGLTFIPGAELSVDWDTGAMHMLVYFLEPGSSPLARALTQLQDGREDRNRTMAKQLEGLGLDLTYEEVVAEAGGTGVGRPHFAAVLARKGYVSDIKDAFERFLAEGRPGYVARKRLDAVTAIEIARESGAVPVIAHPHTLGVSAEDYETAFRDLAEVGLGGIEAYYAEYEPALRAHLADVCRDLGVVPTGGSDYHGTYKSGIEIGYGRGDLEVPDETVELLEKARGN